MTRSDWKQEGLRIGRFAALKRAYAKGQRARGEVDRHVRPDPYLFPQTEEERDQCRRYEARTPAARDAIVRKMRAAAD